MTVEEHVVRSKMPTVYGETEFHRMVCREAFSKLRDGTIPIEDVHRTLDEYSIDPATFEPLQETVESEYPEVVSDYVRGEIDRDTLEYVEQLLRDCGTDPESVPLGPVLRREYRSAVRRFVEGDITPFECEMIFDRLLDCGYDFRYEFQYDVDTPNRKT